MRPRQAALEPFRQRYIAHRGLFDNASGHPENTLAAFQRAADAGYGIELDVQLTSDDQLVVVHDDDLSRLTGDDAMVWDMTLAELQQRRVLTSDQTVPLFADVLNLIDGRVPLIVEIKTGPKLALRCQMTDDALRDYRGTYCVESFDPRVLWWYRRHRPDVIRGQLADVMGPGDGVGGRVGRWALTNMIPNLLTWPDFIAYAHERGGRFAVRCWRRFLRCTLVAWTLKSQAALDAARHVGFSVFIFDSFIPEP